MAGLRNRSQHFQKSIQEDLFREEGLEVFKEFERFLIEHRRSNTTDENQVQACLVDVERKSSNIMAAIKAGIITSTTKEMLTQAEQNVTNSAMLYTCRRTSSINS